ncbi:MAG: NAD(P)-dependent alcohol dehydrogenase [SAR86 cluster bacterium]|uniref:NAD(P)-dependent alcohol dehydrogenase n=1 Tax=SAR86 cluster bacterium TaxID=2030880 RepID=A0A2A5AT44_9GAMM|nr:MAG: NAD(P)-dependent alcohol dehydrogenase [SAR86 cluster bacterium]
MKAAIHEEYGLANVKVEDTEKPVLKDNEVLIKVHATSVNRTDCAVLAAKPFFMRFMTGLLKPKVSILGTEFAGEVVEIGKSVTKFKLGDKVFGFNDLNFTTQAEFMTIAEDGVLDTMPKNASFDEAAVSIEGAFYGYNFINKVKIGSDSKVLVNGGTGGIGSATIQLLKHFDAYVVATCKEEHAELVKSLGADRVICYDLEDFTKDNQKYDFVFDTVGKSSFFKCRGILKSKGVYISSELGYLSQNIFLPLVTPLFGGKKTIFPIPVGCRKFIHFLKELIEKEEFKAVIDRKYTLSEIKEAYAFVDSGQKVGNVVITIV